MERTEELTLDSSVKQNKDGNPILGRLYGPCADIIHPTRNQRMYSQELWEKVFSDPIVNEYFESGGIPGELDHPTDRVETCSEKIAIMMPEKPKKNKDGLLIASFDILDTPNGRITYTLAKYGYKLGISSRGDGDIIESFDGTENVDASSYCFKGFDVVLLPAVKAARLTFTESLNSNKAFKKAINESLSNASADDKLIMEETLNNLHINYKDVEDTSKEELTGAANDAGASIKELQEALLREKQLQKRVLELQEKLSVCYTKEIKNEEYKTQLVSNNNQLIEKLNKSTKAIKALNSELSNSKKLIENLSQNISKQSATHKKLIESYNNKDNRTQQLTESLQLKEQELSKANNRIIKLTESLNTIKEEANTQIDNLNNKLEEVKKDYKIKTNASNIKLEKATSLTEQYRNTARKAINKLIECKANMLGISKDEIINKLPTNYSFKDIETICENLSQYKLSVNNLPFNVSNSKLVIKENKQNVPMKDSYLDDTIDDSFLESIGLK